MAATTIEHTLKSGAVCIVFISYSPCQESIHLHSFPCNVKSLGCVVSLLDMKVFVCYKDCSMRVTRILFLKAMLLSFNYHFFSNKIYFIAILMAR